MNHGVSVVASTYSAVFVFEGLDAKNPIQSMARAYTSIFPNRSDSYKEAYLAARMREYAVDGVIHHEGRTSPEHSNVRYGLEQRLRRATGVRAIVIEADTHDLRLFSMDRAMRKLEDFIAIHEAVGHGGDAGSQPDRGRGAAARV
jgi:benzoyl-CoA reductase/2-hydroxyglutaryl-CoA dehydratase subunit BcrC/BadD/HgdB